MDEAQYRNVKKTIEDCPPGELQGVIEVLEQERNDALNSGDMERADNLKELVRFAMRG
jgi:hypothetical protein